MVEVENCRGDLTTRARTMRRRSVMTRSCHRRQGSGRSSTKVRGRKRGSRRVYWCIQFDSRWSKEALPLVMAWLGFIDTESEELQNCGLSGHGSRRSGVGCLTHLMAKAWR
jgi:hypothetical protein